MFERNRVDNSLQTEAIAAELTLTSSETVKGRFVINASRSLAETLNGEQRFVEFEPFDGERAFIAKATIAAVRVIPAPPAPSIAVRSRDDAFEPFAALGLKVGASRDDIRQAYLTQSKIYHPDRYAGVPLPVEVRDYLSAMARRINAAYQALDAADAVVKSSAEKAKPIFSSPQRA